MYSKTCGLRHLYKRATCVSEPVYLGPDALSITNDLCKRATCLCAPCATLFGSHIKIDIVQARHHAWIVVMHNTCLSIFFLVNKLLIARQAVCNIPACPFNCNHFFFNNGPFIFCAFL